MERCAMCGQRMTKACLIGSSDTVWICINEDCEDCEDFDMPMESELLEHAGFYCDGFEDGGEY